MISFLGNAQIAKKVPVHLGGGRRRGAGRCERSRGGREGAGGVSRSVRELGEVKEGKEGQGEV